MKSPLYISHQEKSKYKIDIITKAVAPENIHPTSTSINQLQQTSVSDFQPKFDDKTRNLPIRGRAAMAGLHGRFRIA